MEGGVGRIRHHGGRFGSKRGGAAGSCFVLRLDAVRRRQDAEEERGTNMDYTPRPPRQAAAAGSTPRVALPPSPEATRLPEVAEITVSRIRACTCWICERPTELLDLRDNRMIGEKGRDTVGSLRHNRGQIYEGRWQGGEAAVGIEIVGGERATTRVVWTRRWRGEGASVWKRGGRW
jgi:hypothetical protein